MNLNTVFSNEYLRENLKIAEEKNNHIGHQ